MSLKDKIAKSWAKVIGVSKFLGFNKGLNVPILCYHSVNDLYDDHADPMGVAEFDRQMNYLANNYTILSLKSFFEGLTQNADFPSNSVIVTFDDGYKDNYENAFSILKKHNIKATIFVVTDFIEGNIDLIGHPEWAGMNWDQVIEMDNHELIDIGAHTHSHHLLGSLPIDQALEEIITSESILTERLGHHPKLFAYPNGQGKDMPLKAMEYLQSSEFIGACSTLWHTVHKKDQLYRVNRVMMYGSDTLDTLKTKLLGHYNYIYFIHRISAMKDAILSRKGTWW